MNKTIVGCCTAALFIVWSWAAWVSYEPPKKLATGLVQGDQWDYVLQYTLTSMHEDRGTWTANVQIYNDRTDCNAIAGMQNRRQPRYTWRGMQLKLAYAGCIRTSALTHDERRAANRALSQSLQGLRKQ